MIGRILCIVGIHRYGQTGRYYSGDGPEFLETICDRCQKVKSIEPAEPEPDYSRIGDDFFEVTVTKIQEEGSK